MANYEAMPDGGMRDKDAPAQAPQQPVTVTEQPTVEPEAQSNGTAPVEEVKSEQTTQEAVVASPEERAALAAQAQADADAAANVAATARKTADELNAALNEESTEDEIAAAKTAEQNAVEAEAVVEGLKANAGVGTD